MKIHTILMEYKKLNDVIKSGIMFYLLAKKLLVANERKKEN